MADVSKIAELLDKIEEELNKDGESNNFLFIVGIKDGDNRQVAGCIQGHRRLILEDTNFVLNNSTGGFEDYFKRVSDLIKTREESKKVIEIEHKGKKSEGYFRVRVDYEDRIVENRHVKLEGYNFENFYNNDDHIPEEITIQIDSDCIFIE